MSFYFCRNPKFVKWVSLNVSIQIKAFTGYTMLVRTLVCFGTFLNDEQVDKLSIQYLFYYLAVYDNLLPPSIVKHHVYKWWYFVSEYRCCILKSAELWNICFKSHKIYLLAVVEKLKCNLKCNNLPKFGFKMPIQI